MKKIATLFLIILFFAGCEKDNDNSTLQTCDVKGTYVGTSTSSTGVSSYLAYELRDNNFAVGYEAAGSTAKTFGGYKNTCDSIILSVFYTTNSNYYLLKGKLANNRTLLSGTFTNLNTNQSGTFTATKQ